MSLQVKTEDNESFKLNSKTTNQSFLLKRLKKLKRKEIFLKIDSLTLKRILEFSKINQQIIKKDILGSEIHFDFHLADYVNGLSDSVLCRLFESADYLDMPVLMEYCAFGISKRIKELRSCDLGDLFKVDKDEFAKECEKRLKLSRK